ncbi:MAG: hypothetical protein U1D55_04190 [Phycisphaerae bacterium]
MQARAWVIGHVQADPPYEAVNGSYFVMQSQVDAAKDALLGDRSSKRTDYSLFFVSAKASDLRDDLRFTFYAPPGMALARHAIMTSPLFGLAAWVAVVSALSYVLAGISGLVVFGRWRGWARLGLWNGLTLVALHFKMRYRLPGDDRSRRAFLAVFSLGFVVCCIAIQLGAHALFQA